MDARRSERLWSIVATAAVIGVAVFGFLVGFVLVPTIQGQKAGIDPWTAFCRAVGIAPGSPAVRQPVSTAKAKPVSEVAWMPDLLKSLSRADWQAGKELAQARCGACHGERGLSKTEAYPHLSGQSAAAIYKQLHDYKSGARRNTLMTDVARALSQDDMLAVSAYFARGNTFASLGNVKPLADYEADRLANRGAPDRGIPACNGCHAGGVGGPIETPTLAGQRAAYLKAQLRAYAAGERGNDVYGRMRTIAARLTPAEISTISEHYAGLPISFGRVE